MRVTGHRWLRACAVPVLALALGAAVDAVPAGEPGDVPGEPADARCVDALYQLQVLAGDWRVYRLGPGDERSYLHDRDRPAEVERLGRERDAHCSSGQAARMAEQRRAGELFQAMGPDCREAREKLVNLQRPSARSAPSDIERQQAWIAAHCPGPLRDGLWLQDWPVQRRVR